MHSPSHRENLLSTRYSEVGFGVADAPDYLGKGAKTIVVAMYASPATSPGSLPIGQSQPASDVLGEHDSARSVTRLAAWSGTNTWPVMMAGLMGLAAVVFISRHSRALHRSLVRSEAFVLRHPWLDVLLVSVVTVGVLLSQKVGSIL
jgi:hypothetical protein